MKKKIFLMLLLVITLGFVTSRSIIAAQGTSEWTLKIDGSVSHPDTLTVNELMAMPKSTVYADLYCYGRLVASGGWSGVSLHYLLENVGFDEKAMSVEFYAEDGYKIDLSITDIMQEDVIIAYEIDGQPLLETLRLVLPEVNGDRWIAMINHITVSSNAASPAQATTSIFTDLPSVQQSPMPQATPTPQPQLTPPSPSPTLSPSPTPSLLPQTTNPNPEQFPITWTVTAVAAVAVAGTVFTVYRKKRNH